MKSDFHAAVIFDVDGPLLDLGPAEEDAFFVPFQDLHGLGNLSRDWDSYRVRNDVEICREILESHFRRPVNDIEMAAYANRYITVLSNMLDAGDAEVSPIPGARDLLHRLHREGGIALGTATANLREAARIRLERADMWSYVQRFPGAAENGGPKRDVLASVIAELNLPKERIVFLGDNLNDLDAGQSCGVHFIGFHVEEHRRKRLSNAGARHVAGDHETSFGLIREFLQLG